MNNKLATKLCLLLSLAAWAAANLAEMRAFSHFETKFDKVYSSAKERQERFAIFTKNMAKIKGHNSKPNVSWKMGVNQYSDMTEEEFKAKILRGGGARPANGGITPAKASRPENFKESVDWRDHESRPITEVKNQGMCGSCWAHAAVEQIESYSILKYWPENRTVFTSLSVQEVTSCMPNPNKCGGSGGCKGSITPMAYRWIQSFGLTSEEAFPYTSGRTGQDGQCNLLDITTNKPRLTWTRGYETLPANDYWAHIKHLNDVGPLDVGVDATGMMLYESGVMKVDDCNYWEINHAVQLVGYGTDEKEGDYWLVRNSWGKGWGEGGYIKLQRNEHPKCGVDTNPLNGDGCADDGIKEVTYCGCLGILGSSAYPIIA